MSKSQNEIIEGLAAVGNISETLTKLNNYLLNIKNQLIRVRMENEEVNEDIRRLIYIFNGITDPSEFLPDAHVRFIERVKTKYK